jgi:predicted dehydrogenase
VSGGEMRSPRAERVRVGIVGCGAISAQYLEGCRQWDVLEVVACADRHIERARAKSAEYGIEKASEVDALLADPSIELIVNLTPAYAHGEINLAALEAGKHVYSEKPLAATWDEALAVVEASQRHQLLVGCAPDTFLGGGLQTCRKIIDDGWIGTPIAAVAFMTRHGTSAEAYNSSFDRLYDRPGGGVALNMGQYDATALVALLGPARRVFGVAQISFAEREIRFGPRLGHRIPVEVPTHITGTIEFASNAVATFLVSWDVWVTHLPYIEIYGSDGSLSVPDPDSFGGTPAVRRPTEEDEHTEDTPAPGVLPWTPFPLSHSPDVGRGIGVADMALAIRTGRTHRASAELALHILEILLAFEQSSETGEAVELQTTCERPAPLPLGLLRGQLGS